MCQDMYGGLKATVVMDFDYPTFLPKESPDRLKEFLQDTKYKAFPVMEALVSKAENLHTWG